MYANERSRETRRDVLLEAIGNIGLATLATGENGLHATLLPLTVLPRTGQRLVLAGHFARANSHWRSVGSGIEALAIFQGPHCYVSPGWYATKAETGKSVPTWAYVAVEARGTLRLVEDRERLRAMLDALTADHEEEREAPWSVDDAPADYIAAMMRGIVGFELEVSELSGVWKLNQSKSEADRRGMAEGLAGERTAGAAEIEALVRSGLKEGTGDVDAPDGSRAPAVAPANSVRSLP
jgi:transcriptional regulator